MVVLPCLWCGLVAGAWGWNGTPEHVQSPPAFSNDPASSWASLLRKERNHWVPVMVDCRCTQAQAAPVVWRRSPCFWSGCYLSGVKTRTNMCCFGMDPLGDYFLKIFKVCLCPLLLTGHVRAPGMRGDRILHSPDRWNGMPHANPPLLPLFSGRPH